MNIRKSLALTIVTPLVFSAVVSSVLVASVLNAEHQFAHHQNLRKAISACNTFMTEMLQGGTTLAIVMQGVSSPFNATAHEYNKQFDRAEQALDTIESLIPRYKADVDTLRHEMRAFQAIATRTFSLSEAKNQHGDRKGVAALGFDSMNQARRMQGLCEEFQNKLLSEYKDSLSDSGIPINVLSYFAWVSTIVSGLLTILAGTFVSRRIVGRMSVLRNNTEALSQLHELSQPLSGDDEIAEVDKAFHSMAKELVARIKRARLMTDNALDVICSISEDALFKTVSPSCTKLWHKTPEELIGKGIETVFGEEQQKLLREELSKARSTNSDCNFSLIQQAEVREETTATLCSIKWDAKERTFYCVFHDDSNNERRRVQIRESEEHVRRLLASMPVAILVLNENGQIQLSNRSFHMLLEEDSAFPEQASAFQEHARAFPEHARAFPEQDDVFLGRSFREFLPDGATNSEIEKFFQFAAGKSLECDLKSGSNSKHVQITVEDFEWNQQPAWLAVILDIDARHQLESARQRVISAISHDVKTPLSSVLCSTGLLMRTRAGEIDDLSRSKLEVATSECGRLVGLFDGLLSMQRFGGLELSASTFKSTNLSKLSDDVIEAVSDDLIKHGINIECNAPSQMVSIDADRLEECLAKLCRLLMKISKPRSEHQIDVSLANNVVIVSVQLADSQKQDSTPDMNFDMSVIRTLAQSMGGSLSYSSQSVELIVPALTNTEG